MIALICLRTGGVINPALKNPEKQPIHCGVMPMERPPREPSTNRLYEASLERPGFARQMNLREGMSEIAAAVAAHAMFPPAFELIALLKMTGDWGRDGKLFYREVRTTANQLSKDLGKLRKAGELVDRGEAVALKALDDYELLAINRNDPVGDMLAGWIGSVRQMHRSMIEFGQ